MPIKCQKKRYNSEKTDEALEGISETINIAGFNIKYGIKTELLDS